eukprot:817214-Rhodomonas_salina.4
MEEEEGDEEGTSVRARVCGVEEEGEEEDTSVREGCVEQERLKESERVREEKERLVTQLEKDKATLIQVSLPLCVCARARCVCVCVCVCMCAYLSRTLALRLRLLAERRWLSRSSWMSRSVTYVPTRIILAIFLGNSAYLPGHLPRELSVSSWPSSYGTQHVLLALPARTRGNVSVP